MYVVNYMYMYLTISYFLLQADLRRRIEPVGIVRGG